MFRHILPNALQPIIVYGTIAIGTVILSEAALSFLGVGPQFPTPAWGLMVAAGSGQITPAPHLLFFPGAAIFLSVLAFVFVGDGLRAPPDPTPKLPLPCRPPFSPPARPAGRTRVCPYPTPGLTSTPPTLCD